MTAIDPPIKVGGKMCRRQYSCAVLSIIIIVFFSINGFAQNVNDAVRLAQPGLGMSARALGMGNSYVGLSDDASAAYFNPAGLGLLRKMEIAGGINYNKINNSATFQGASTDYSNSNTDLDQISFAFPFPTLRGSLVFGMSYHKTKDFNGALSFNGYNKNSSMIQYLLQNSSTIPYDLYLADKDYNSAIGGGLNQSGTILQSGTIDNYTFSGAMEINRNLFLGANIDIISGKYENSREYYEDDSYNLYQGLTDPNSAISKDFRTFYLNDIINWDLSGYDLKLGLLYQFQDFARFGATIQFPKTYKVKEDYKVAGSSDFSAASVQLDDGKYSDKVEYTIVTPYEFSGGVAINYRGFIFSGQITYIDYTQTQFEDPTGISDSYIAGLNKNIKDQLNSVVNYNLGLEYTFSDLGLRIRGGYFVQPSPYKGDPSDYNKKYVTGGFGFLVEDAISIDFAYLHGFWKDYGDNYGTNLSRTYQDLTLNKIIVTGTYHF
jgi:long-subunit fatty acid transport protein